jgi:response regulator RpfG family c-di-GMP phosphodiesterase
VAAGGAAYYAIIPAHAPTSFDDVRQVVALPLMAAVMYAVNSFPSCVAAGLQFGKNPFRLWLNGRRVDALQTVALFLLGLVTALTVQQHAWALAVMTLPAALIYVTLKRSAELLDRLQDNHTVTAVEAMADTVDLRNPYTQDHSRRVADLAVRIARTLNLPELEVEQIRLAARVHNIGNIGVSDQALRKPGKLTADEWEQVEKHVRTGYDILGGFAEYRECREIVLRHHERWDGSGYPQGLQGIQSADTHRVQVAGQILGVADAIHAMTSDRPYRAALTLEAALDEIREEKGRHWHPAVVDAVERLYATPDGLRFTPAPVRTAARAQA